MELMPWRPAGGLTSLRREMDDLWSRFFNNAPVIGQFEGEWTPSVDVTETKDSFIVKAELPGLEAKDINVSLTGNLLTIKGEKKKEKDEKDENHHYVERYYGSFQRSFQLPANIKSGKIDASFDKGVLKVTLPKTEDAKKKEIKINVK
ncbi:Hsp20/alpha crystallin family protein [Thermodesulfobacteriota bacterium]